MAIDALCHALSVAPCAIVWFQTKLAAASFLRMNLGAVSGIFGLAALPRRARTTDSRLSYPMAPNLLARNFTAQAPSQIWLADLTYIPTGRGWPYLAAILDTYTRDTRDQAKRDIFAYIEGFCNSHRLHSARAFLSPADMERKVA